jgi:hypothetical protein
MAIVVESTSNTPTFATRTNSTITAPTGITNGDVLVAVLSVGDASGLQALAITPATGFTEVTNSPAADARSDPYTISVHVFWKVASSEAGNYTFSHSSAGTEGFMYRLSGVNTASPIDGTPAASLSSGSNGLTTGYGSVTTGTNGAFVIYTEALWDGVINGTITGTTPTATLRRSGTLHYIADGTQTTAGATSARTRNPNGNNLNSVAWASLVVAIKQSTGAAPTSRPIFARPARFITRSF